MPELPEVETTTRGLQKEVVGKIIKDVWTDLNTKDKRKADTVANPEYFKFFKKEVQGRKIIKVERRAKNILVHLSGGKTILIHLKMTGHLLYGAYKFLPKENKWVPDAKEDSPLNDPFNRFVHFVFTLSDGKHLAFCDTRKFGKITLFNTKEMKESRHLQNLGPEPLHQDFNVKLLKERLTKKPSGKIKTVLMDQSILVGVGNIYSDEILWASDIHPERKIQDIADGEFKKIFKSMQKLMNKGIDFGGDSMSDYRNIYGLRGEFQMHHRAYRRTGEKCMKKNCEGVIIRKVINGRSGHFCPTHQI